MSILHPQLRRVRPRAATRIAALLAASAVVALSGCASATRTAPLTADQRAANVASFDHVWTTIRDKHYDANLNGNDWEAVRSELRPQIEVADSESSARAVLRNMIDRLGESHFAIIPAAVYASVGAEAEAEARAEQDESIDDTLAERDDGAPADDANDRSSGDPHEMTPVVEAEKSDPLDREDGDVGITVRVVDEQALIVRVRPGSPADQTGVRAGWVITEIDGRELAPMIEAITKEYADSSLRELVLTHTVEGRLSGPVDEEVELALLDGADEVQELTLVRVQAAGKRAKLGNMPPIRVECGWRWLRDNIGYIHLNLFFDPPTVMRTLTEAMREMRDARGVIFDIRGNGGGIGGMAMGISGLFVRESGLKLGTMNTRSDEIKFVVFSRPNAYQGPLAILVDGGSASTSEIFAGGMQAIGRARIFGTPTPGAALPSIIERLPNGDGFQYAFANYVSEDGTRLEGQGVTPDELAPPVRAELLAGRDPAIEAAIRWVLDSGENG